MSSATCISILKLNSFDEGIFRPLSTLFIIIESLSRILSTLKNVCFLFFNLCKYSITKEKEKK